MEPCRLDNPAAPPVFVDADASADDAGCFGFAEEPPTRAESMGMESSPANRERRSAVIGSRSCGDADSGSAEGGRGERPMIRGEIAFGGASDGRRKDAVAAAAAAEDDETGGTIEEGVADERAASARDDDAGAGVDVEGRGGGTTSSMSVATNGVVVGTGAAVALGGRGRPHCGVVVETAGVDVCAGWEDGGGGGGGGGG